MTRFKIWYYTTIKSGEDMESVYESFPDEIEHEGKKRVIRLTKESIESVVKDADYAGE